MTEQLFYLRQAVKSTERFTSLSTGVQEHRLILHYYVRAEDTPSAGGAAGSFCLEHGLECVDYLSLPQQILRSQIAEHETEHIEAYEFAEREGFAVVAAAVLSW
jgi:hypothetical protein